MTRQVVSQLKIRRIYFNSGLSIAIPAIFASESKPNTIFWSSQERYGVVHLIENPPSKRLSKG